MNLLPGQIVDDLVYVNSDDSPNLENYDAPDLAVNDLPVTPPARTKS